MRNCAACALSAQKGRLVADLIRGQPVDQALNILAFSPKKGAQIIKKVLESAIANAEHNDGADIDELKVTAHLRRAGTFLKRFQRARQGPRQPHHEAHLPHLRDGRRLERGLAMGQKIHPIGFRLAVNRNWTSRWYANSQELPGMLARGHQGARFPEEEARARRGGQGRHRAPGQERAHHHLLARARAW